MIFRSKKNMVFFLAGIGNAREVRVTSILRKEVVAGEDEEAGETGSY